MVPVEIKLDLREWVVVHPGKHWNSKTFPASWWQGVIDGLVAAGKTVCVIGKDDNGDAPTYETGARGTVDVTCPEGCLDLRNLLGLEELAALLSKTKTLISNDSFPIHLAGAFDNQIILIPSCKHPDHVLPWRNGSIYYKAKALYKRLVIDDVESRPTQCYSTSAEVDGINWDEYLPDPAEVISAVE
jgi:ADP-heptose:LPS heptosyltransferase